MIIRREKGALTIVIVFILVGIFHVEGMTPLVDTSYADVSPIEIHKGALWKTLK